MKIHPKLSTVCHTPAHANRRHGALTACFFSLALILSSGLSCRAQCPTPTPTATPSPSCTPDPTPTPNASCTVHENSPCASSPCPAPSYPPNPDPPVEAIPDVYQPHDAQGSPLPTVLEWRVYEPTPVPSSGHGPSILLLHEGHFATGNIFSGTLDDPVADLREAGYYVFVAAYPLAPCGLVRGQPCHANDSLSGRPPQQTDAVKAFIRAMKNDSRCNGCNFGVVGGSSGASHAAFSVFDTSSTSVWPNWNDNNQDDRPLAVACLSGAYDFTDRTADPCYSGFGGDPIPDFRTKIENYTGKCVLFDYTGQHNDQWSSSPVAKLPQGGFTTEKPFRPMYFIHARYDSMPYHQLADVQCKLAGVNVDSSQYEVLTIQNSTEHAFQYWRSSDGLPNSILTISGHVISFLNSHLQ